MHRMISESWWRRWAGWSAAWVLGWLLLLILLSDGPAYAPHGLLSIILPIVFGMPVLVLCARWIIPRLSHVAMLGFKAQPRDRRGSPNT